MLATFLGRCTKVDLNVVVFNDFYLRVIELNPFALALDQGVVVTKRHP